MIEYFHEEDFIKAKKQKDKTLAVLIIVAALYLLISVAIFIWYRTLPYQSPTITLVKCIHYPLSVIFVLFCFIYLGIPFKRVNRYYKLTYNLIYGLKETSVGSFLEYDETLQDKDGVDFKSLIFLEWNKYKNDFHERKVLIFNESEFPILKENMNVRYVTQGNVLIRYEILENPQQTGDEQ